MKTTISKAFVICWCLLGLYFLNPMESFAQGVSFSYLFPKNGYISAPISPFSIRGIGLTFGNYLGVDTGGTLYYMSGLGMEDLPFETQEALTGPNFSILVPGQLYFRIPSRYFEVKLLGGGFGIRHLNPRLNYGNLDRAIADFEGWDVANADFEDDFNLGGGWMAGIGFEFYVSDDFSLTMEVQYLSGGSLVTLDGNYAGGNTGGTITSVDATFEDAKVLLQGIELSLGANF